MRKLRGFSIIELMVVLAIAGVLASVAIPGFKEWIANSRRVSALNDFVGSMAAARSEAVKLNTHVAACASKDSDNATPSCTGAKDWAVGWFLWVDTNSDMVKDAGETVIATHAAIYGNGITLNGDATVYAYRADGRLLSDAGAGPQTATFQFCDSRGDSASKFIDVPLTGRPDIEDIDLNGDPPSGCP